MHSFDVIIVGNGILGLTSAYFLKKQQPNLKVALVGNTTRKGSASLAAGAMLNLWGELTDGNFESEVLVDRFNLTKQGFDQWEVFASELSEFTGVPLSVRWGTYLLRTLRSTQIEERAFSYTKQSVKRFDIPHKELLPQDLPFLKPSQCSRTIEALWVPDGSIDSRKVIRALDIAMDRLSVVVLPHDAAQLLPKTKDNDLHSVVLATDMRIYGKHVVLANGAYAQYLIDQNPELRRSMPRLLFGIGSGVNITFPRWVHKYGAAGKEILDLKEVVRTTDRGGACGVHLVPYGDGTFYAGASSGISLDDDLEPKLHGVHTLLHALTYEMHRSFFYAGIGLRGNGFRPVSADCFPMIGETQTKGIWMLNGTKRDGFTMSPYVSNALSAAILGKANTLPSRFFPARKLISYKSREIAILDTELMYIGADYQHGGSQTPYMADKYNEIRKKEITSFYDRRGLSDFGIHPELIHLYENDEFFNLINHERESSRERITSSSPSLLQTLKQFGVKASRKCAEILERS